MALWVKFRKYRSRGRPLKERERGSSAKEKNGIMLVRAPTLPPQWTQNP